MNHPVRTAAPTAATNTHYAAWQQAIPTTHTHPSHFAGYSHSQRVVTAPTTDRTIPASPATPGTPGLMQNTSNTSGPWSAHDDEILLQARAQSHGWNQIQRDHFPNKTPNACRKRYERLVAKRRGSDWNDERIDRVASRYMQMREQTWRPLADAVGENWEDVEKLCLERGAKNLLPPMSQREAGKAGSDHVSRASHDSHDDERVSIPNLIR
ncbi:hypothetical protein VTO42DRAFT_1112 [Malbranchea cinnamomea]